MRGKLEQRKKRSYMSERLQFSYDTSDTEWLMTSSDPDFTDSPGIVNNNYHQNQLHERDWKSNSAKTDVLINDPRKSPRTAKTEKRYASGDKLPICFFDSLDDNESDEEESWFESAKFQDFPITTEPVGGTVTHACKNGSEHDHESNLLVSLQPSE